jgi:ABC-2 type transport system permease protein
VAGIGGAPRSRQQLLAIARLRWQSFGHSLRTTRGAVELASHVFVTLLLLLGGLVGAAMLGSGAYSFVVNDTLDWIALLLWSVFFFWQLFPIMGSVFTETVDLSNLLRFPLTYRSYFLVRLAYGVLDPSTMLGVCWLTGITLGISLARPGLLPWTAVVLFTFGLVNLALMQAFLAWVERWMAQRRTREIFGILFFLLMIGMQLLGPLAGRYGRKLGPEAKQFGERLSTVQRLLPPGAAAAAIADGAQDNLAKAGGSLGLLLLYVAATLSVMGIRVKKQYLGENLSEATGPTAVARAELIRPGWRLPWLSSPTSAVFEKELRYLGRSGPMLLTLVTPVIILAVFGLGPAHNGAFLMRSPDLTYPVGVGYALILLTNLIYNNFGADGGGVQFFLASPVRFRTVILGKNLAHLAILLGEAVILWVSVSLMFYPPTLLITATTFAALLFAAPLNFAAGNLLSLYSPKRVDFGTFGRQRAAQVTVLLSLFIQAVIIGCCVATFLVAQELHRPGLAIPTFLGLGAVALALYGLSLRHADALAAARRETLLTELCRA